MKKTLLFLLQSIIDHPDDVIVTESTQEDTQVLLTITCHSEDIGKIIGKNGRIIRALRDLMKIMAAKENTYVDVVLQDDAVKP